MSSAESAILQVRPDSTQILYEVLIPEGVAAVRWHLIYDRDHNGRLSEDEYNSMAQGIARTIRDNLKLKLEGNDIPVEVVDAKIQAAYANDGLSGKISALVILQAREIPPGLRKLEIEMTPLVDAGKPAIFRLEPVEASIESIAGAIQLRFEDGTLGVKLQAGTHCVILIDVPVPKRSPDERPAR